MFGDSQFTSTLSVNFHFPKIPRRTLIFLHNIGNASRWDALDMRRHPLAEQTMEEGKQQFMHDAGRAEITRLGRRLQHLRKAIGGDLPGGIKGNFAFDDRFGLLQRPAEMIRIQRQPHSRCQPPTFTVTNKEHFRRLAPRPAPV
ncbi:hypothetical protein JC965_17175 [Aeromonas caviae]|uniref:Uncharacterized protein n=1 Tax=Aeromonas caviae TaxID=648 RepID=A0A7T3X0H3_AERCA|nr:hypothetical protein JC965_17175 [Aeromonas caviae]